MNEQMRTLTKERDEATKAFQTLQNLRDEIEKLKVQTGQLNKQIKDEKERSKALESQNSALQEMLDKTTAAAQAAAAQAAKQAPRSQSTTAYQQ